MGRAMSGANGPAPIALLVYNRPAHTSATLDALADSAVARFTPLHVFGRGPRTSADALAVEQVRHIVGQEAQRRRFASVTLFNSRSSSGLRRSRVEGVSAVVDRHGRVIVLGDDLVGGPDLLTAVNACLDYYEADPTVVGIAGQTPMTRWPARIGPDDDAARPGQGSHGWATWADRWNAVDWSAFPEDGDLPVFAGEQGDGPGVEQIGLPVWGATSRPLSIVGLGSG